MVPDTKSEELFRKHCWRVVLRADFWAPKFRRHSSTKHLFRGRTGSGSGGENTVKRLWYLFSMRIPRKSYAMRAR